MWKLWVRDFATHAAVPTFEVFICPTKTVNDLKQIVYKILNIPPTMMRLHTSSIIMDEHLKLNEVRRLQDGSHVGVFCRMGISDHDMTIKELGLDPWTHTLRVFKRLLQIKLGFPFNRILLKGGALGLKELKGDDLRLICFGIKPDMRVCMYDDGVRVPVEEMVEPARCAIAITVMPRRFLTARRRLNGQGDAQDDAQDNDQDNGLGRGHTVTHEDKETNARAFMYYG